MTMPNVLLKINTVFYTFADFFHRKFLLAKKMFLEQSGNPEFWLK